MKIALLGNGKTGQYVDKLHTETTIFNTSNTPTIEKLKGHDVIISFLSGEVFANYIPLLVESKIPVVSASTGGNWQENLNEVLKEKNLKWIYSNNYSLGMNIVKQLIETLSLATNLFDEYTFDIHEVHHTQKLDSPSGTAISFKNWLGKEATITSERTGDVVGEHEIKFNTDEESISINHSAHNRAIFAKGAIWAAKSILTDQSILPGLNHFNDVVSNKLNI